MLPYEHCLLARRHRSSRGASLYCKGLRKEALSTRHGTAQNIIWYGAREWDPRALQ